MEAPINTITSEKKYLSKDGIYKEDNQNAYCIGSNKRQWFLIATLLLESAKAVLVIFINLLINTCSRLNRFPHSLLFCFKLYLLFACPINKIIFFLVIVPWICIHHFLLSTASFIFILKKEKTVELWCLLLYLYIFFKKKSLLAMLLPFLMWWNPLHSVLC